MAKYRNTVPVDAFRFYRALEIPTWFMNHLANQRGMTWYPDTNMAQFKLKNDTTIMVKDGEYVVCSEDLSIVEVLTGDEFASMYDQIKPPSETQTLERLRVIHEDYRDRSVRINGHDISMLAKCAVNELEAAISFRCQATTDIAKLTQELFRVTAERDFARESQIGMKTLLGRETTRRVQAEKDLKEACIKAENNQTCYVSEAAFIERVLSAKCQVTQDWSDDTVKIEMDGSAFRAFAKQIKDLGHGK